MSVTIDGEPEPREKDPEKIFYTTKKDIERGRKLSKEIRERKRKQFMDDMNMNKPVVTDPKGDLNPDGYAPVTETKDMIEDVDNPLTDMSVQQIEALLRNAGEMVKTMESMWMGTQRDFQLKDSHMKALYQYNETHKKEMPKDLSNEEKEHWDRYNGFDNMTDEDIAAIFEKDHPIVGVMASQTIDRIKMAMSDYITWLASLKEYKQINDAYMTLVEMEEQKRMDKLKEVMENETDPQKKEMMKKSLDMYYNRKYIDFIAEPLSEKEIATLVKNYNDPKKIEYYTNRTLDKLKSLHVSTKFILEISKFEIRFLTEKYHKNSNILLLWFMQKIIFSDPASKPDDKNIIMCFIICMDRIIRDKLDPESRQRVFDNIIKFEDQFVGKL